MHAAGGVAVRHLLVHDAAPGGHPLHVASGDRPGVAEAVGVIDGTGEDVGDRLDAAMRMPREALEVIAGHVVAEIIQQQERIDVGRFAEAEGAPQVDPGAFHRGRGRDVLLDGANRHARRPPAGLAPAHSL